MYENVAKLPHGKVTVAKLPCGKVTGNPKLQYIFYVFNTQQLTGVQGRI